MILWRSALDERMLGYSIDLIDNEYTTKFEYEIYNRYMDVGVRYRSNILRVIYA